MEMKAIKIYVYPDNLPLSNENCIFQKRRVVHSTSQDIEVV